MIPKLIESYESSQGFQVNAFSTGVSCICFETEHLDYENSNVSGINASIENYLEQLPPGLRVKFISNAEMVFDKVKGKFQRSEAVAETGWIKHSLTLVFEKNIPKAKNIFSLLTKKAKDKPILHEFYEDFAASINIDLLKSFNLQAKPVGCNINLEQLRIKSADRSIWIEQNLVGVLKLSKFGNYECSTDDLCLLRESLPEPFDIICSIEKIDEKESQLLLNNKSKREESGGDLKSHKKYLEAQRALEEIDNQGKKVFKIEFTILLWDRSEENILSSSLYVKDRFKKIGEFTVEDHGVYPSFCATLPAGKPHIENIEITDRVTNFIPAFIRGRESLGESTERSFLFHRSDDSLDSVDVFSRSQNNFSGIVIGKSGRGKSVFTNNLLRSLTNDKNLKVILVDVKGSHTNTVKNLGGNTHKISTSSCTAISPFNFLRFNKNMDVIEILSDFLEKLLLEDFEVSLKRAEQAILEECLLEYAQSNPSNPSIDDFVKKIKNIPRSDTLKRWVKGGVYGNIFSPYDILETDTQIQYFDFTNIVTAQKGGVSSAIMSAIMAHFNYTLLSKGTDERLVFIADETPFFVRSCFTSFSLLMKNVRKLNGSLFLIAQNLSDLIVDGDSSLISQTECRVYFSKDEDEERFDKLSGLSPYGNEALKSLGTFNGKYAQFVIKTNDSERVGKLRLSKHEYFGSTTLATDRSKIEKLKELLNLDTENQAIEILADLGRNYEISI